MKNMNGDELSLEVRFLGGTREVGRSAVAVKTGSTQVLLDYGVMIEHEPGFPTHVPPKEVNGIFMTHSHLDHSGAIPIFQIQEGKPVYGTNLCFDLSKILISDFIHLSSYSLPFEYLDLRAMMQNCVHLDYGKKHSIGDFTAQLLESGHIPGSSQVLVEANGKKLVYTSDYNATDTRLLRGANTNYGKLDALVVESTYANENHPDRTDLEKEFMESINEVVENGGTVLVPAFGVGRSQEIACVLAAHNFQYPVLMDGMVREVNRVLMNHKEYMRDPKLFMDAMLSATWVEGWYDRRQAFRKPGVIISTAGMLKGGPAAFYIQKIGKKQRNAVFLVSYQIPGTPGRELLEKGRCVIDGRLQKIKAQVKRFDFSSHSGASQLREAVKNLEGNPTIYVIHGAEGNCEKFSGWIKDEIGLKAVAPRSGEAYMV